MVDKRFGQVALIGQPNAGKSTLMNRIVGSKVSIVTHKAQTTRTQIRGIAITGETQIVFVDTPGLFAPRNRLDQTMVAAAWKSLDAADIILLIAMAHCGINQGMSVILDQIDSREQTARVVLVINKIDLVRRDSLLETIASFSKHYDFESVFLISATKGDGVGDLVSWLEYALPLSNWMYSPDQIADASLQSLAAEITREKLMLRMHQEIPYQLAVITDNWHQFKDGSVRIDQSIIVASNSHKRMIIGPKGGVIGQIGKESRKDIQQLTSQQIHLFLQVKTRPKWIDGAVNYQTMGQTNDRVINKEQQ